MSSTLRLCKTLVLETARTAKTRSRNRIPWSRDACVHDVDAGIQRANADGTPVHLAL